jgi:hypothetical protein
MPSRDISREYKAFLPSGEPTRYAAQENQSSNGRRSALAKCLRGPSSGYSDQILKFLGPELKKVRR